MADPSDPFDGFAELRKRLAAAHQGPMFVHDFRNASSPPSNDPRDITISCDHPASITVAAMYKGITGECEDALANAQVMAHAFTDLPDLLKRLDLIAELSEAQVPGFSNRLGKIFALAKGLK